MNQEIQKILADLYQIDSSLRSQEGEIIKIINELLAAKPDTKFDENFRQQLRTRIMQKISAMPAKKSSVGWFTVPRFAYALGGLAVLALIILPTLYFTNKNAVNQHANVNIKRLASNAFGSLVAGQSTGQSNTAASEQAESLSLTAPSAAPAVDRSGVTGLGGGGSVSVSSDSAGVAVSPQMMPIRATNYKFVYKGGDLPQLSDNLDVLKHVTDGGALTLSSVMANTGLNFIDWSKFSNTKLQNISFTEDRNNGYQVYVNFDDGSVSINQNYQKWVGVNGTVQSDIAMPYKPVKIGDVPSDSKIIDVADSFLRNYGISLVTYGQPFVQNDWRIYYDAAPDKTNYYIPEQFSVIYPLVVNGKEVYDESGNKAGLNVNVNIRQMAAIGVYNLMSQNYQASSYGTEKDSSRIIKLAENGGFRQTYYGYGGNGESQEIVLGAPTLGLVQMWFYRDNQNQQLLIPSYIFPITSKPAGAYYYQNSVVVPVIKDVLDWGGSSGGGIVPMMRGAVETQPALVK